MGKGHVRKNDTGNRLFISKMLSWTWVLLAIVALTILISACTSDEDLLQTLIVVWNKNEDIPGAGADDQRDADWSVPLGGGGDEAAGAAGRGAGLLAEELPFAGERGAAHAPGRGRDLRTGAADGHGPGDLQELPGPVGSELRKRGWEYQRDHVHLRRSERRS